MRKFSKNILVLEALLLTYPTILGILICFGAIVPFVVSGNIELIKDFIIGAVILLALISGWRLFFWVITDGPSKGSTVNFLWWIFTFFGGALTTVALVFLGLSKLGLTYDFAIYSDLLVFGGFFLIPLIHLYLEAQWQKTANKLLKTERQKQASV